PYADVEAVLIQNGIPPTSETYPRYTVPAIIDSTTSNESPKIIADSMRIADYLESAYPEYPIYPGGSRELQVKLVEVFSIHVRPPMAPIGYAMLPALFEGRDRDAFVARMNTMFGGLCPADLYPAEKRDEMWAALYAGLDTLASYIDENGLGKTEWLFGTDGPAYADFVLAAWFFCFKLVGPEGCWDRIKGRNGGRWERLHEACQKYTEVL
ncbi:hypothetical protein BJ138DRAFT_1021410, partial [Hygrophoropsis aurantiaca]